MRMPLLAGIETANHQLRPYLQRTPLVRSEFLSSLFKADVWLKNETVSPISSFKLRGALTVLLRRGHELEAAVTSSTGNHGLGVAYAARLLQRPAHIFVPDKVNPAKESMIQFLGATLHPGGYDLDAAKTRALAFAEENGFDFVDDGNNAELIEGAGTVGLEIARSLENVDWVLAPMGSGSLISGCALAVKNLHPHARICAVQSKGAPAMTESFHRHIALERPAETLAEGLVCRIPADLALRCLWEWVDDALLVHDEELLAAVHSLAEVSHILTEPSGAAALAGAYRIRDQLRGLRVVLILTGANITIQTLQTALATPPLLTP